MRYKLEDLIELYADQNEMDYDEAWEKYERGLIQKVDLLGAYLEEEGIFGYTSTLWSIYEALGGKI